jgi:hypothetical protein
MNTDEPIVDPSADEPLAPPAPAQEPPKELTLDEHEAQFPSGKHAAPTVVDDAPPDSAPPRDQARDERGQFTEGRRRAASQRASSRDVPRINELTRRNKELEGELARLRRPEPTPLVAPSAVPTPQSRPQATQDAPRPAPEPPPRYVIDVPTWDPTPQEHDPRFGGDLMKYMQEFTRWSVRQEQRQLQFDQHVASERQRVANAEIAENKYFAENVERSMAQHDDFEEVAFHQETPIRKDSVADIFIRRDENGPEMLYYLHSHRKELDELLAKPELEQAKFLTLLSQRLSSNGAGLIGGHGPTPSIAQPRTIVLPPKPPNGVRTEAQRAPSSGPPDRELSLAEHEAFFTPKPRR